MNSDYYSYERRKENTLARAYVPFQTMNQVYSPNEALKRGTIFPELYRTYTVGKMNIGGDFNG